jgi:hypothetical protein
MALVRDFQPSTMTRNTVHDEVSATFISFTVDGRKLVQIDSYGRSDRELPGKKSQSLQLDIEGAKALIKLLRKEFDLA